jgi:hypothetical protein
MNKTIGLEKMQSVKLLLTVGPETITISSMIEPEEIILGDGMDEDWDSLGKGPGHSKIVSSDHSE